MIVKVYSSPTCKFCTMVRDLIEGKGVSVEVVDITQDEDAMSFLKEKGIMGVPVTEVGNQLIVGYDRKKILEAIGFGE